jgi:hypothetical protein
VFEQQQNVADSSRLAQLNQLALQPQPFGIADDAELN